MSFTNEEFEIMVEELLFRESISFAMLCNIANKTLRKRIEFLCANDEDLRGRGYEDDIMQEIQLRLMKTTVSKFLLKDGDDGTVNADPIGFKSWMYTLADNIKRDFAKKVRRGDFKNINIEDPVIEGELITPEPEFDEERLEQLREAFSIVLSADVNIYKILTWIAQFIFVIELDVTKIQSNYMIIETFEKKTLFEMYDMLLRMSEQVAWIEISQAQHEKIIKELSELWENDVAYGNVKYEEFFMKVNGKKSGKKSISDWVNRMNGMIQKKHSANKTNNEEGH